MYDQNFHTSDRHITTDHIDHIDPLSVVSFCLCKIFVAYIQRRKHVLDLFKIVLFSPGNLIDIGHADHITDQGAVGRENTCHTIWDCICVRRVKTINLFRSVPTFLGTNLFECFVQDGFCFLHFSRG